MERKQRVNYSPRKKAEITFEAYSNPKHGNITEVAKKYNVTSATIRKWKSDMIENSFSRPLKQERNASLVKKKSLISTIGELLEKTVKLYDCISYLIKLVPQTEEIEKTLKNNYGDLKIHWEGTKSDNE